MPELGKIIQISNLFSVPVDDLVRDERELVRESGQDIAFVKPTYSQGACSEDGKRGFRGRNT